MLAGSLMATAFVLTSCATVLGSQPVTPVPHLGDAKPALPSGEVVGRGMVIDVTGSANLCAGIVLESLPPQCDGIPLVNLFWDGVDGGESLSGTRWGLYAVQGTFDGVTLHVTRPPILLEQENPATQPEPAATPAVSIDEDRLLKIDEELSQLLGDAYRTSWTQDGGLVALVDWDDGTLQTAADSHYGERVVVIESLLEPVG